MPKQDASHLYQPQVVGSLLLVAHQNRPAFRQPAQRPLHYPASRRIALLSGLIELLLADLTDVRDVAPLLDDLPHRCFVVAFVQTQMLIRRSVSGSGALDHEGIERVLQELEVGHVRSGYHHRKRTAICLEQKGAFDPILGSVGGIRSYEIPPKRALPIAPSAACHAKSTQPSSSRSSISFSQIRSNTPSSTHLCNVRCTEGSSGNSSLGRRSHWQPLRILKMIASRAWRWSMRGRPVLFRSEEHTSELQSRQYLVCRLLLEKKKKKVS